MGLNYSIETNRPPIHFDHIWSDQSCLKKGPLLVGVGNRHLSGAVRFGPSDAWLGSSVMRKRGE
jgi:hypothetical protein